MYIEIMFVNINYLTIELMIDVVNINYLAIELIDVADIIFCEYCYEVNAF
jgi:hypothetical protein